MDIFTFCGLISDGKDVECKSNITSSEEIILVNNVVQTVFGMNIGYAPTIKNIVTFINVINLYFDVEYDGDIDKVYNIVYGYDVDIFEIVYSKINKIQLNNILSSIENIIELRKGIISRDDKYDDVLYNINEAIKDIRNVFVNLGSFVRSMSSEDIDNKMDTLLPKLVELNTRVSKISDEDIINVIRE